MKKKETYDKQRKTKNQELEQLLRQQGKNVPLGYYDPGNDGDGRWVDDY